MCVCVCVCVCVKGGSPQTRIKFSENEFVDLISYRKNRNKCNVEHDIQYFCNNLIYVYINIKVLAGL
jgi:hypothetical protein